MPGTAVPFAEDADVWRRLAVDRVLCLTPTAEIERRSPAYARAVREATLPCRWLVFPIDDYGVPEEAESLLLVAQEAVAWLRTGERLVVHCGAGVGRTGTVATCILLALGLDHATALTAVREVGSEPETEEQQQVVVEVADLLSTPVAEGGGWRPPEAPPNLPAREEHR